MNIGIAAFFDFFGRLRLIFQTNYYNDYGVFLIANTVNCNDRLA